MRTIRKAQNYYRTWCEVTESTGDHGGNMSIFVHEKLGEAKVRHVGLEAHVEKYIARFDVPVNYRGGAIMVQVRQSSGRAKRDLHSRIPIQRLLFLAAL